MICYKCGQDGHIGRECPLNTPAGSYGEHMARIGLYVRRWASGEITLEQKRSAIAAENYMYYGPSCRKALLWPPRET